MNKVIKINIVPEEFMSLYEDAIERTTMMMAFDSVGDEPIWGDYMYGASRLMIMESFGIIKGVIATKIDLSGIEFIICNNHSLGAVALLSSLNVSSPDDEITSSPKEITTTIPGSDGETIPAYRLEWLYNTSDSPKDWMYETGRIQSILISSGNVDIYPERYPSFASMIVSNPVDDTVVQH